MPTIVTTIGSASANSYVTSVEASAYFESRLTFQTWSAFDEDTQRIPALLTAAQRLQRENWLGSRVDTTQALAWPRDSVFKIDTPTGYFGGFGYAGGDLYLTTEIPQEVKDAQCELALWLLTRNTQPGAESRRVTQWSADGVSAIFEYAGTINAIPEDVYLPISRLIADVQIRRG